MSALRDRCNVHLRVHTANPNTATTHKPRRRRSRKRAIQEIVSFARPGSSDPYLYPINTPLVLGLSDLHRLLPYIYTGFTRSNHLPSSILSPDGSLFTHIIQILPGRREPGTGTGTYGKVFTPPQDNMRGISFLEVHVGDLQRLDECEYLPGDEPRQLVINRVQLSIARDFLGLALPYYHQAHRMEGVVLRSADTVRVLVTAPWGYGLEIDIMAIVVCYLAYASEEPVGMILDYIRAEEGIPSVWKDAVEDVGVVEVIHRAAQMDR